MHDVDRAITPYFSLLLMGFVVVVMFGAFRMFRDAGKLVGPGRSLIGDPDEFRQRMERVTDESQNARRQMLDEMRRHNDLIAEQTKVQVKLVERLEALIASRTPDA